MEKSIGLIIKGRVQGVYYREAAVFKAKELGVKGFVRNLPDGTVECVIQGEEGLLEQMINFCKIGSKAARVDDVRISFPPKQDFDSFQMR
jgi:acylphosphatase